MPTTHPPPISLESWLLCCTKRHELLTSMLRRSRQRARDRFLFARPVCPALRVKVGARAPGLPARVNPIAVSPMRLRPLKGRAAFTPHLAAALLHCAVSGRAHPVTAPYRRRPDDHRRSTRLSSTAPALPWQCTRRSSRADCKHNSPSPKAVRPRFDLRATAAPKRKRKVNGGGERESRGRWGEKGGWENDGSKQGR